MTDRRRRQKEQRAAKREAEKKQVARKELSRRLGVAIAFGVVVVGIITLGTFLGEDDGALPAGYEAFRSQPTACGAEQPAEESVLTFAQPDPQPDVTPDAKVTATLETSCGDIVIELDVEGAPQTANSFVFLAKEGFFDGQVFYRIDEVRAFSGDPEATGSGGPGYRVPDEFPAQDFVYTPGVVAMDNTGKGTTGSRFFVVVGESTLNPTFNVLGRVTSGDDALERIAGIETSNNQPLETVYIESAIVEVTGS